MVADVVVVVVLVVGDSVVVVGGNVVVVVDAPPGTHSTCSKGAPPASPSYDSAIRELFLFVVSPVMMSASELPADQPERSTISWMIAARLGVRCWGPAAPVEFHAGGDHETDAVVLVLFDTFLLLDVNVAALLAASP